VANLKRLAASRANPHARGLRGPTAEYRPGDKVIQLRNNYDKNLFNGDIGTVTSVDATAGTLEAEFDGERQTFDRGEFGDLALAYAISIHKSQGSEYPVVIIPLLKGHFMNAAAQTCLPRHHPRTEKKSPWSSASPPPTRWAVRNRESKLRGHPPAAENRQHDRGVRLTSPHIQPACRRNGPPDPFSALPWVVRTSFVNGPGGPFLRQPMPNAAPSLTPAAPPIRPSRPLATGPNLLKFIASGLANPRHYTTLSAPISRMKPWISSPSVRFAPAPGLRAADAPRDSRRSPP